MNPPEGCSLNAAVAWELRTIVYRKRITIKEFARQSGIGARSMSLYLNGSRGINVDQLGSMCRGVGDSPNRNPPVGNRTHGNARKLSCSDKTSVRCPCTRSETLGSADRSHAS